MRTQQASNYIEERALSVGSISVKYEQALLASITRKTVSDSTLDEID
jgi:hypothetical protein